MAGPGHLFVPLRPALIQLIGSLLVLQLAVQSDDSMTSSVSFVYVYLRNFFLEYFVVLRVNLFQYLVNTVLHLLEI